MERAIGAVMNDRAEAGQASLAAAMSDVRVNHTRYAGARTKSRCRVQTVRILAVHPADVVDRSGKCVHEYRSNSRRGGRSRKPGGRVACCSTPLAWLLRRSVLDAREPKGLPAVRAVLMPSLSTTGPKLQEQETSLASAPSWMPAPP